MSATIIAIDGPAGSGKSSVSKQVARELNFGYLDTGAAYRALAWACLNLDGFGLEQLETKDLDAEFAYSISTDPDNYWVKVGDVDVTDAIRESAVAEFVSQIARIPQVRTYMKGLTHRIVATSGRPGVIVIASDSGVVMAGSAAFQSAMLASGFQRNSWPRCAVSPRASATS